MIQRNKVIDYHSILMASSSDLDDCQGSRQLNKPAKAQGSIELTELKDIPAFLMRFRQTELTRKHRQPLGKLDVSELAGLSVNAHSMSRSHSKTSMVTILMQTSHCGVDIEPVDRQVCYQKFKRMLTEKEYTFLESLPELVARERFLTIWTVKEAVVKAMQRDLAYSFPGIEVQLSHQGVVENVLTNLAFGKDTGESTDSNQNSWQKVSVRHHQLQGHHISIAWLPELNASKL